MSDAKHGQEFLERLAIHAPRFMALSWPKNILSVLCAEVIALKADVDALKKAQSLKETK